MTLQLFLLRSDAKDHYAHGPFLPLLNTEILHRRRQEGRAIHKGGPCQLNEINGLNRSP
jgi:hypothetical protein